MSDVLKGLVKTFAFSTIIVLVGAYQGLKLAVALPASVRP